MNIEHYDLALGHSLGEFSALYFAKSLSLADAVRLLVRSFIWSLYILDVDGLNPLCILVCV